LRWQKRVASHLIWQSHCRDFARCCPKIPIFCRAENTQQRSHFVPGAGQLGRLAMTIRAGGRVALIAATGLLACVVGVSWTVAASSAAEQKSEQVSTSKKVKQVRYYKRYAHRKYTRNAQKSSE